MPPTEQSNKTYQPHRHHHQMNRKLHNVPLNEQHLNTLYLNKNTGLLLAKRLVEQTARDQIKKEHCDNYSHGDDENNNYRVTRNITDFIANQLNTKEVNNEIKSEVEEEIDEDQQPMDIDVVSTEECNLNNICHPIHRETIQVAKNLLYEESDAVRFGRVPKNEKDRISHAMKAAALTQHKNDLTPLSYKEHVANHYREPSLQVHNLVALIIRQAEMHADTITTDLEKSLTEMRLYDKDMRQLLEHAVSRIVIFAKNLPGFEAVQQPDQITLLRACVVEISLIHLACMINTKCEKIIAISGYIIFACVYDGCFTSSPAISKAINVFVQRLKSFRFESSDIALLSAAALVNPRRESLNEVQKIQDLNKKIVDVLATSSPIYSKEIFSILREISSIYMDPNLTRSTECSDPQYIPEERKMETSSPTSTLDEEMSPPGSAESGYSAESGCSTDSAGSNDSGICVESVRSSDSTYSNSSHMTNMDEVMEVSDDLSSSAKSWHNPTYVNNDNGKESVLLTALKMPSRLALPAFNKMVSDSEFHQHKKFRRTTNNLSPPYNSCSPSPSSSLSSSPSRVSSSPYSSPNPSSPVISTSILAQRLSCPIKTNPKGTLMHTLSQESKFVKKVRLSDTLHSAIMNGDSRIRQHVLAAPSPSRHDSFSRTSSPGHHLSSPNNSMASSPVSHMSSPPHNYSSPNTTHLHSPYSPGPTGLGASAMSGCNSAFYDEAQPLNLSTKTPPPIY